MNTTATATHRNSRPQKNNEPKQAIDEAVRLYRQPNAFAAARREPLPLNIIDVIKASAGDDETLQRFAEKKNVGVEQIREATQFYLRNLIISAGEDPYRKLVLERGAAPEDIRDHKRWLLKWLHPDRNPNKWESNLFTQVSDAVLKLEQAPANANTPWPKEKKRRKPAARPQFYHPVAPSTGSVVKSILRKSAVAFSLVVLALAAIASGVFQDILGPWLGNFN